MRLALWLVAGLVLAAAAAAAWVRLAPEDPALWHVDPLTAPDTGRPNAWRVLPEGGDAVAPVFDLPPVALAARLDAIALAEPRTRRLAGSPEALHATYVQRSRLWGFPDYVSVRVLDAGEGRSTLAIFSRARFGQSDLGVNRARVEKWLAALGAPAA